MMKIAMRNVLYFFVFIVILIGCQSEAIESNEGVEADTANNKESEENTKLDIAYSVDPLTLDPHIGTAIVTSDIMGHVFETLLTVDEDYNIQPMLAESFEQSEDGKTITFELRENVKFHNGQELIADDVVASMNRWKDGLGGKGQFTEAQFEKVDDYTVVL